jgi:hypothetical protein
MIGKREGLCDVNAERANHITQDVDPWRASADKQPLER